MLTRCPCGAYTWDFAHHCSRFAENDMSRKTRTHPDRRERTNAPPIARVAPGHYRTSDGIDVVNMNDGKRDACWVARKDGGKVLATDGTLRGVRRKLERLGDALALARKIAAA